MTQRVNMRKTATPRRPRTAGMYRRSLLMLSESVLSPLVLADDKLTSLAPDVKQEELFEKPEELDVPEP